MSDFDVNWNEALKADESMGDGGFSPIPKDTYTVRVLEAEAKQFSTGNPGVKLKLAVVGGPYADRLLWSNLVWNAANPQSLGMFSKKVKAFGVTQEWLAATNPSLKTIAQELLGRMASASVEVKEFQGKSTNDVKRLSPLAGAVPGAPVPIPTPGVPSVPTPAPAPTPTVVEPPVVPPTPEPVAPPTPPLPPVAPTAVDSDDDSEPF